MDARPTQDYLFCTHCQENVSESTFRRHMNLVNMAGRSSAFARSSYCPSGRNSSESDSSSESEGERMGRFIKFSGCLNCRMNDNLLFTNQSITL